MPELSLVATPAAQEAKDRRRQMLRTAFGPTIAAALVDPAVLEVMVNPDGRLWIDRAAGGRTDSGQRLGAAETERIIRLVAADVRREVTDKAPIVSAELPDTGERFEGVMPPVATAPCFSIRKPAEIPYRLADYVAARILTPPQANVLAVAVRERRNIVVAGGTSSGKTTLVNALLAEVATLGERVLILEDTRELRCAAEDVVALRTKPGVASLADLVRSTLRLRPDRIIVGEVRGRGARHAQGVEHRPSGRAHHGARQLRGGSSHEAGAAGAGSGRDGAASADRRGDRHHCLHQGSWWRTQG
jgi:type IV secretion system protein VirB11